MRAHRLQVPVWLVVFALAACQAESSGNDQGTTQPTADAGATDGGAESDTGPEPDTESVPDTAPEPDTDSVPDTESDTATESDTDAESNPDTAAESDAGSNPDTAAQPKNGDPNGPHLQLTLSTPFLENAANKGSLTISCQHVDKNGQPLADPGDLVIETTSTDAKLDKGVWTFAKAGKFWATCASKSLGWQTSADFVVSSKGVDPALTRLAGFAGQSATLLTEIIALGKQGKKADQKKALQAFDKAGKEMIGGFVGTTKVLLPLPAGLPELKKLQDKGLKPGQDDAKWLAGVDSAIAALKAMKQAIAAIDPKKPSAADVVALETAQTSVNKALGSLKGLKPSAIAVYGNLAKVQTLVGTELASTMKAHHAMLSKAMWHLQKTQPPPPCPTCFSLVGTMVSIGIQYTLASIPSYTGLLKDMGWAIGEMALTLVIKDVVDDQFPPQAGGPSIDAIAGFSAVAVTPGTELKVLASHMGDKPGQCGVVFITPVVSKTIVDSVKLIMGGIPSLKDLKSKGSWEAAKAIKSALDQLKSFIELGKNAIPNLAENGVLLMGSQSGSSFSNPMIIKLGVVPKKANCGWLPKPGILIPYCRSTGRGASFTVTVIGKNC